MARDRKVWWQRATEWSRPSNFNGFIIKCFSKKLINFYDCWTFHDSCGHFGISLGNYFFLHIARNCFPLCSPWISSIISFNAAVYNAYVRKKRYKRNRSFLLKTFRSGAGKWIARRNTFEINLASTISWKNYFTKKDLLFLI